MFVPKTCAALSTYRLMVLPAAALVASLAVPAHAWAAAPPPPCTVEQGDALIEAGRYKDAVKEFTCVIGAAPTGVEGYRGRIEAELLLGRYSDAVRDYTRVAAFVEPVHPDAEKIIYANYDARLAAMPTDVVALTGSSFARWWFFDYGAAMHLLDRLLEVRPNDVYGNLFSGSSRLLRGAPNKGPENLELAIALAPTSPDVRYIVADAYTYGLPDPARAFAEASLALEWGLDTPRVHAILASACVAFGDPLSAGIHIQRHMQLVTTELVTTAPIVAGTSMTLNVVPGRVYDIPLDAAAGEAVSVATSSKDFWDTILVLLGPDGSPVLGSDDAIGYYAAFDWVAPATGTYRLRVTSFEAVSTGDLVVRRD